MPTIQSREQSRVDQLIYFGLDTRRDSIECECRLGWVGELVGEQGDGVMCFFFFSGA